MSLVKLWKLHVVLLLHSNSKQYSQGDVRQLRVPNWYKHPKRDVNPIPLELYHCHCVLHDSAHWVLEPLHREPVGDQAVQPSSWPTALWPAEATGLGWGVGTSISLSFSESQTITGLRQDIEGGKEQSTEEMWGGTVSSCNGEGSNVAERQWKSDNDWET